LNTLACLKQDFSMVKAAPGIKQPFSTLLSLEAADQNEEKSYQPCWVWQALIHQSS